MKLALAILLTCLSISNSLYAETEIDLTKVFEKYSQELPQESYEELVETAIKIRQDLNNAQEIQAKDEDKKVYYRVGHIAANLGLFLSIATGIYHYTPSIAPDSFQKFIEKNLTNYTEAEIAAMREEYKNFLKSQAGKRDPLKVFMNDQQILDRFEKKIRLFNNLSKEQIEKLVELRREKFNQTNSVKSRNLRFNAIVGGGALYVIYHNLRQRYKERVVMTQRQIDELNRQLDETLLKIEAYMITSTFQDQVNAD